MCAQGAARERCICHTIVVLWRPVASRTPLGSILDAGLNTRMQPQACCHGCSRSAWTSPLQRHAKLQGRAERGWLVPASSAAPSDVVTAPAREKRQTSSRRLECQVPLGAAAVAASLSMAAAASAATGELPADAAASSAAAAAAAANFTPGPVEIGWEIWAGFVAGVIPFVIASVEFGKRVLIQRRCPSCRGRGLVQRGRFLRKCSECGGMLPWMGWRYFLLGTFDPGNGGFLLQPRGQTSVLYSVPPPLPRDQAQQAQQGAEQAEQEGQGGAEAERPVEAPAAGKQQRE